MKSKIKPFIIQTARDYSLPILEVKYIYDNYFDEFYEKLEEIIKSRRNR